ncbi:MAG: 5-(carboxyamino)imidazole ribonucleotide synthase [Acidobacteriota bacterium]
MSGAAAKRAFGSRAAALPPGSVVGVLGSGQLGRMLAFEAVRMGYRVHTFSPAPAGTPTGQVAEREISASYEDLDAVEAFARGVDVVTFEFENVASAATEAAARHAPVRPAGAVLHTTQHRLREKSTLRRHGFPVTPFAAVDSAESLRRAAQELGLPAVLKTAGWGYDGKGQWRIEPGADLDALWVEAESEGLGGERILEAFVRFEREISVVAARGVDGEIVSFEVFANDHRNHVLDLTVCPAPIPDATAQRAREMAAGILESLDVVGVMCVELFVLPGGSLLVNELAPRPHNSGHLTLEACRCSQFEQQLRAVTGLPLGSTESYQPAAMANLLGDLWFPDGPEAGVQEPAFAALCRHPGVRLHLYGKVDGEHRSSPRPGRKMGHLTVLAPKVEEARERVVAARRALAPEPDPSR